MNPRLASAVVFGTSACVLVLEILAGRLLAPIIGVSLETFTGIIGTVLAGIVLGNAIGGRLADRHDPAALLGPVLMAGGVLSWLAPILAATLAPVPAAGPLTIVVFTAVLFFAPAVLLSTVGPLVAKLQLRSLDDSGKVVGNLSAAGSAGALAGTFLTGFVLVPAFGTRAVIVAVGALLVVAGAALGGWTHLRREVFATIVALGLGVGAAVVPGRCDTETAYACVAIVADPDRPSGRLLLLNGERNSYVDLDDPEHLEFRYTRLFAQVLDSTAPDALDVVHIGGAGLAVPRYLEATRPGSSHLVLEVDGELVEVVDEAFGDRTGSAIRVDVGDARLTLAAVETASADVVIGDAFSGLTVPWHLTTRQYTAEMKRVLRPGGMVVLNLVDGGRADFAAAGAATLAAAFRHVVIIEPEGGLPPTDGWNIVVAASDTPLDEVAVDPADGTVLGREATASLIARGLVLDDDFAPVDQLRRTG
ncbi:MAG: fused MFS/spermidine synthase [Actinomycetota bacterium]